MLRILIVEDEPLVRIGLVSAVDWSAHGYELVGEASDGKEALELCESLAPDIVITDIRMPRMDGLEFVRRLRSLLPAARVLVLSAHDEFAYAREAIKLGVEDYLLKMDISPAALLESLAKVSEKCVAQREEREVLAAGEGNRDARARADALRALLRGPSPGGASGAGEDAAPGEDAASLGPAFASGRLVALCALTDGPGGSPGAAARPRLLADSAAGLVRDCLRRQCESATAIMPNEAIASVLAFDPVSSDQKLRAEIDRAFSRIRDSLERSLGITVSVGASVARGGPGGLARAYEEARKACGQRFFGGPGRLYVHGETGSPAAEEPETRGAPELGPIVESLLDCDRPRLLSLIGDAGRTFKERGSTDREARLFFYRLACAYLDQIDAMGGDSRSLAGGEVDWIERFAKAESLDELTARASSLAEIALDFVLEHRSEHRQRLVAKANAYIDANFAGDISLESLSDHLNINSSYFCKIYRQATGRTFVERLTKVRLEKAKALLQGTDLMVYDVAAAAGYNNPEYFCRLFKKATGVTPLQYRNAARANGRSG